MAHMKFDYAKLEKLNDPGRAETIIPNVMWEALAMPDAAVLVEIGAGTGFFARRFAELSPGAIIHAVDIAPVMIEWMQENVPEVQSGTVVPLLAQETRVGLDSGIADVVYMINLHHELADPVGSYAEARRLLKSGGRMMVVDWADRETPRGPRADIRVSVADLKHMLEYAGFHEVESHEGLPWHHLLTATKRGDAR